MTALLQGIRQFRIGRRRPPAQAGSMAGSAPQRGVRPAIDIAPNDPLLAYFLTAQGAVEIEHLRLESPALDALRAEGVKLTVPLVSQGELIGVLNLGPRRSDQDYSSDDRGLLANLAAQAAPAVRVAQLVREQQEAARARERIEQELRVARLIQQTLLPKERPVLPGWKLNTYYQPARAVGGDFYDFLPLADGRLGIVIADVTDKGVPAALVMATTRSILRSMAPSGSPGVVLERVNDLLYPDIPEKMFVTCFYAVLDPVSGRLHYANAGHDLPYRRGTRRVDELRATGMPLGLMPGMRYEEKELVLGFGETVLFYTDGLVEAHNAQREMFSFPRLMALFATPQPDGDVIAFLLDELGKFTGTGWEQEDDVTLVTLQRTTGPGSSSEIAGPGDGAAWGTGNGWRVLAEFTVPSQPGNERVAMEQVAEVVAGLDLPAPRLERLKTAVAEATMNAMEHGNQYRAERPVELRVLACDIAVAVQITDRGSVMIPAAPVPDLQAKLQGTQSPRGWGLFLIKSFVDAMRVSADEHQHTVELIMNLGGETNAKPTV